MIFVGFTGLIISMTVLANWLWNNTDPDLPFHTALSFFAISISILSFRWGFKKISKYFLFGPFLLGFYVFLTPELMKPPAYSSVFSALCFILISSGFYFVREEICSWWLNLISYLFASIVLVFSFINLMGYFDLIYIGSIWQDSSKMALYSHFLFVLMGVLLLSRCAHVSRQKAGMMKTVLGSFLIVVSCLSFWLLLLQRDANQLKSKFQTRTDTTMLLLKPLIVSEMQSVERLAYRVSVFPNYNVNEFKLDAKKYLTDFTDSQSIEVHFNDLRIWKAEMNSQNQLNLTITTDQQSPANKSFAVQYNNFIEFKEDQASFKHHIMHNSRPAGYLEMKTKAAKTFFVLNQFKEFDYILSSSQGWSFGELKETTDLKDKWGTEASAVVFGQNLKLTFVPTRHHILKEEGFLSRVLFFLTILFSSALSFLYYLVVQFRLEIKANQKSEIALIQSEKFKVLGHLAGSIAHEINNPLTALEMQIDIIKKISPSRKIRPSQSQ